MVLWCCTVVVILFLYFVFLVLLVLLVLCGNLPFLVSFVTDPMRFLYSLRYGVQGFKMFDALRGKFQHILNNPIFNTTPNTNGMEIRAWQLQNKWYKNMKKYFDDHEFFSLLAGKGAGVGLFMDENRQARRKDQSGDEGYYAKLWSVIKNPPSIDYSKITAK